MKNNLIKECKRDIVRYLLNYKDSNVKHKDLKFLGSSTYVNDVICGFKLAINDSETVEISIGGPKYDLVFCFNKTNKIICLYDDKDDNDLTDEEIQFLISVKIKLGIIMGDYEQNCHHKNKLISKVLKIYDLLNDKKHHTNDYVEFNYEENGFVMTTIFSSEKNIKILIKDNYIYYTFHGTYVEYNKWTPAALRKITQIIDNLLSNIKEIENDYLIKPICNPEEKNNENILLIL